MLVSGADLIDCPVLSLHVGGEVARVTEVIVDPNSLKVVACRVEGAEEEMGEFLETKDVREFSRMGMIIDSTDELVSEEDAVRLSKVLELNFNLVGLKVVTKKGAKLGKVSDYIVETDDFVVQQLIVQRPAMKALLDPELVIARSEVVEIDDYKVVVKDGERKVEVEVKEKEVGPGDFVNPFRKPNLARADNQSPDEQDRR